MSDFMKRARKAGLARMGKDNDTYWTVDEAKVLLDFLAGVQWAVDQETDGELAVRELHAPREEQVVTGDCSIESCDHEDECPTVPFLVCTECWRVTDEADPYFGERGVWHVAHPCATVQVLDSARAARRDKEKR